MAVCIYLNSPWHYEVVAGCVQLCQRVYGHDVALTVLAPFVRGVGDREALLREAYPSLQIGDPDEEATFALAVVLTYDAGDTDRRVTLPGRVRARRRLLVCHNATTGGGGGGGGDHHIPLAGRVGPELVVWAMHPGIADDYRSRLPLAAARDHVVWGMPTVRYVPPRPVGDDDPHAPSRRCTLVIQGNASRARRNYPAVFAALTAVAASWPGGVGGLAATARLVVVGRGARRLPVPETLRPLVLALDDVDERAFHRVVRNATVLVAPVDHTCKAGRYLADKMTSSLTYALGYGIPALVPAALLAPLAARSPAWADLAAEGCLTYDARADPTVALAAALRTALALETRAYAALRRKVLAGAERHAAESAAAWRYALPAPADIVSDRVGG